MERQDSDVSEISAAVIRAAPRRGMSVRRTSTIDVVWPHGADAPGLYYCAARDIFTGLSESAPEILDEAEVVAHCVDRTLLDVTSTPSVPGLEDLRNVFAGGKLRARLAEILPAERDRGDALYLLLDDLAGATLVSRWGLYRWFDRPAMRSEDERATAITSKMLNVCHSFQQGFSALAPWTSDQPRLPGKPIPDLQHPCDPAGWHNLEHRDPINFRRARLIDVWVDDNGLIQVEALFQDSASDPLGGRRALHEYRLGAVAEPEHQTLLSISAHPGNLPYRECPGAVTNIQRLVGTSIGQLRNTVLERLTKTEGCTHLNDALRALADVPRLLVERASRAWAF